MKTLLVTFFLFFGLASSGLTYAQNDSYTQQKTEYVIISPEKFKEIEAKMNLQEDWNPIRIKGYSKEELVAFYIQSYSESIIETWVDFAYKKMHRFEQSKPTSEQDEKFQKMLELPRTAENAYHFMMLMTLEQIETVGY